MKRYLQIITILSAIITEQSVLGQCNFEIISRPHLCSRIDNKWKPSFPLGILPLEIKDLIISKNGEIISIKGILIDKQQKDPVPLASISLLSGDSATCNLKSLSVSTDSTGRFDLLIKAQKDLRLYFSYVGFEALELKILNCP